MPSPAATAPQDGARRSVCGVTSRTLSWSNHCQWQRSHADGFVAHHPRARAPEAQAPPTSRWPGPGHRPARGVQVNKDVIASDFGPQLMQKSAPTGAGGAPELVQLLPPGGGRVAPRPFAFGGGPPAGEEAETIRGFSRDRVLPRRID